MLRTRLNFRPRIRFLLLGGVLAGCGLAKEGGTETTTMMVGTTDTDSTTTTAGTTETGGATETGATTTVGTTDTDTDTDTATMTEAGTDTEGPQVCPCILNDPSGEDPSPPLCGEPLCPTIDVDNQWACEVAFAGDDIELVNPEALTCALTALRDRTPGLLGWSCGPGTELYEDYGYVLIGDDGTAIRRHWGKLDLSYVVSEAQQGALPDPGVFEQCLADGDAANRFECLRKFLMGDPILVCDEGWRYHSD